VQHTHPVLLGACRAARCQVATQLGLLLGKYHSPIERAGRGVPHKQQLEQCVDAMWTHLLVCGMFDQPQRYLSNLTINCTSGQVRVASGATVCVRVPRSGLPAPCMHLTCACVQGSRLCCRCTRRALACSQW
jgi:hypothetical protein